MKEGRKEGTFQPLRTGQVYEYDLPERRAGGGGGGGGGGEGGGGSSGRQR
jgi:hypothetical protein